MKKPSIKLAGISMPEEPIDTPTLLIKASENVWITATPNSNLNAAYPVYENDDVHILKQASWNRFLSLRKILAIEDEPRIELTENWVLFCGPFKKTHQEQAHILDRDLEIKYRLDFKDVNAVMIFGTEKAIRKAVEYTVKCMWDRLVMQNGFDHGLRKNIAATIAKHSTNTEVVAKANNLLTQIT